ncbi:hypothetical protein BJ875DRAFT_469810 [Amylocarpus encephaloides]|uniref:Secreted protein n=1 Tax=Amylocarpus encephaloides TaxID=45428 RepID=A0A9P7YDX9_9HELO|nr:hypothetical protein BJ875DRAFT_469810 [Amylocarpus encephaloides]
MRIPNERRALPRIGRIEFICLLLLALGQCHFLLGKPCRAQGHRSGQIQSMVNFSKGVHAMKVDHDHDHME